MRRLAVLLAVLAGFATTASAEAKLLVRYDLTGGIAGRSDRLVIDGDRTAKQTSGRRGGSHDFTVSSKQLRALKRELKAARFKSLKRRYQPRDVVNDGLTQTVTYKGRAVSVTTGARYPDRLHRVLQRLGGLMRY